jgi:sugar/nucleoside kinase (ribokinase family)
MATSFFFTLMILMWERSTSVRVVGIGDNVVDKYVDQRVMYPGGNSLNFAVFAKKLSVESSYIGVFGDDEAAAHIKHVLDEIGVDYSHSISLHGENGFARVIMQAGERTFLPGNAGGVSKSNHLRFDEDELRYIKGFDLIHSSCYSYIEDALQTLSSTGVPISFDFSDKLSDDYLASLAKTINFGFLSCGDMPVEEVEKKLRTAVSSGCDFAVASRGSKGSMYFNGDFFVEQHAFVVEPIDTMGAGDSFLTSLLVRLLMKDSLFTTDRKLIEEAMAFASSKAAETCMVNGTFGYGKSY